jgi:hypothetical protein
MTIHEKGPKAERDRYRIMSVNERLYEFFRAKMPKEKELATMSNHDLYRLGQDLYNRQSNDGKRRYEEHVGGKRINPLALKWYLRDLKVFYRAKGWRWLAILLMTPFRYPGFVRRSRESLGL